MKKILCIISTMLVLILSLTDCSRCVSKETSIVQAKIIDEFHKSEYTTLEYDPVIETNVNKTYPDFYLIVVEYDTVKYKFYDSDTYNKYFNKVGEHARGVLETKKYADGTVEYNIVRLE